MSNRAPYLNRRLQGLGTTVFATMSALAEATGSINLGQGFPDYPAPAELLAAARQAIADGHNQYPPGRGVPVLREAIAAHQERHYGLRYDPASEVLVTAGATEALAASVLSLCEVGDEIIVFEPYYDAYPALAQMAGARHRTVRLRPPDWSFEVEDLRRAVTPRTRLVLLNSPHNPTGKVFSEDELAAVAALCVEEDLLAVTDEVYEHLVFEGRHLPLASFDGMAERTVTISSGGKTFSVTGWKIGWVCAPAPLVSAIATVKQFLTFASGTPLQHAVAAGLALAPERVSTLCQELAGRRDRLCDGLARLGFEVFRPASGYFCVTDIAPLGETDATAFCASLPGRAGVVAIPTGVFYDDPADAAGLVRWAFCKEVATLDEALARLAPLAGR